MQFKGTIRRAVVGDVPALATVHVESWKTTYKGILSDDLLEKLSIADRLHFWNQTITNPPARFVTLVACDENGSVVGFASGGEETTGQLGCDGELRAMYLLQRVQRRGLGTLLINHFVRELRLMSFNSMAVWVLARNPARAFYQVLGARRIGERAIERGGHTYIEVAYAWTDLTEFDSNFIQRPSCSAPL